MTQLSSSPNQRRGVTSRLGFGLVEQGATAALSFVVVGGAARVLSDRDFGTFALLNGTYILLQTIEQALISEATVVAHSSAQPNRRESLRRAARDGAWASSALGVVAFPIALLLGAGTWASLAFALVTAVALMADCARGILIASSRVRQASVLALAGLILTLAILASLPTRSSELMLPLISWGAAFVPVGLYGLLVTMRTRSSTSLGAELDRKNLQSRVRKVLLAEAILAGSAQYTALLAVDAFVSRGQAGSLRLAISIMGPVSVLFNAIRLYGVAELQRRDSMRGGFRLGALISALMIVVAGLAWIVIEQVPSEFGTALVGPTWTAAMVLLPWAALHRAAIGATLGVSVVLRAQHQFKRPLVIRTVTSPLAVLLAFTGAALSDATGALLGLAIAATVQAVALFVVLRPDSGATSAVRNSTAS